MDKWWIGKDSWFDEYYSNVISDEFAEWWEGIYGHVSLYTDENDIHEYFTRMAFAWKGWVGGKSLPKDKVCE